MNSKYSSILFFIVSFAFVYAYAITTNDLPGLFGSFFWCAYVLILLMLFDYLEGIYGRSSGSIDAH